MGDDVHLRSVNKRHDISIHVPRMGDDNDTRYTIRRGKRDFNPRPPHGGRRVAVGAVVAKVAKFQSASPAWGTTREYPC